MLPLEEEQPAYVVLPSTEYLAKRFAYLTCFVGSCCLLFGGISYGVNERDDEETDMSFNTMIAGAALCGAAILLVAPVILFLCGNSEENEWAKFYLLALFSFSAVALLIASGACYNAGNSASIPLLGAGLGICFLLNLYLLRLCIGKYCSENDPTTALLL